MIITVSIVKGFQGGIREKVIGFDSHIQIAEIGTNYSMESSPMLMEQDFLNEINAMPEIRIMQPYAYKPGVLQSFQDSIKFSLNDSDTMTSSKDILGVIFKGVNNNYNWEFLKNHLEEGEIPDFDSADNQIVLSKFIADKMGYELDEEIDAFFIIGDNPKKRKFTIAGIYDTGFEEFDKQLIFCDLENVQELNNWGIQTYAILEDTCYNGNYVLRSKVKGGNNNNQYNWGRGFKTKDYFLIDGSKNADITLIAGDFKTEIYGISNEANFLPDTARISVKIDSSCSCDEVGKNILSWDQESNTYTTNFGTVQIQNGAGNSHLYAGGMEIILNDYSKVDAVHNDIQDILIYDFDYEAEKITDRHAGIFGWLEILDMNINIVIILILIVSLINMITSLLVLILEKTNMIGVLKAIGTTNRSIRIIFLYHSFYLLGRGLLWGNLLGIGLILLQHYTGFLSLNPEVYFLDKVPVSLNIWYLILINLLTVLICRVVLYLPSLLISRIRPIHAIKFD